LLFIAKRHQHQLQEASNNKKNTHWSAYNCNEAKNWCKCLVWHCYFCQVRGEHGSLWHVLPGTWCCSEATGQLVIFARHSMCVGPVMIT